MSRPSKDYEDQVRYDLTQSAKVCVHFRPIDMYRRGQSTGCVREVPIRVKAIRANGGSQFGIALRLPCDCAPDPLFRCSWREATGIERARDNMVALREAGRRTLTRLAKELTRKGEGS